MNNFYNSPQTENRPAWRSAAEVRSAALEHEKRRFQMLHEYSAMLKPQDHTRENQPSGGWLALIKAPQRLLASLLG